jgi:NADH-quinone oxidoreductase subunit C
MNQYLQCAVTAVQTRFGAIKEEFRGEVSLILPAEHIQRAAQVLRDELEFDMLIDVTAVDYWPKENPRLHVIYEIYSTHHAQLLRLRVPLEGSALQLHTLEGIYPAANWYEREVWDMFGVQFEGHSDLRRIVLPADMVGHPLRKDYPLGYEEVQFSFNLEEIDKKKPYASE